MREEVERLYERSPTLQPSYVDEVLKIRDERADGVRAITGGISRAESDMLAGVVDTGTGTLAAVEGYSVAGKTGTTRKFEPDLACPGSATAGCYGDDVVASFIGIGPTEDTQLAVGVFIDSPSAEKRRTGGTAAAPAFSEVMRFALHQLGVPPSGS